MNKKIFASLSSTLLCIANTGFSEDASIHPHGYWCGEEAVNGHIFDSRLSNALADFFAKENAHTIADFGCGLGDYVKVFLTHNFHCEGFDGNPDTYQLSQGVARTLDLSEPVDLGKRFDWVLSLEVGEHIPKEYEHVFLDNLDRHNVEGIVLSWAIKGQGGWGHFNEQSNEYIKSIMTKRGYINDIEAEQNLRNNSYLSWFKNTIMVFRKQKN